MKYIELVHFRKKLGLTQKELAQLLATSLKAVHSYEQGWRTIPENVYRQILFLVAQRNQTLSHRKNCWTLTHCPVERKRKCPAWLFKTGQLCWFITGTLCQGQIQGSWSEKIEQCKTCSVFKPILEF
ncbi:MAG: two-CW domain-containing protein [Thermodesulfobacteriota bacterium]